MSGATLVSAVTRSVMALALATGLVVGATQPAAASTMTDATMVCAEGTGSVYFGLPLTGSARMSVFAYRLNGGGWAYTNWYYTSNGSFWMYDGGWAALRADSSMTIRPVGGNKLVEGFEYRYNPSTGSGSWISLGSCRTSSFFESGITYN